MTSTVCDEAPTFNCTLTVSVSPTATDWSLILVCEKPSFVTLTL